MEIKLTEDMLEQIRKDVPTQASTEIMRTLNKGQIRSEVTNKAAKEIVKTVEETVLLNLNIEKVIANVIEKNQ